MKRPDGFTMIEVLLATAIAAMLMLALLSVTASLGRAQAIVDSQSFEPSWRANLIQVLERDFALARRVELNGDEGFVIEGLSRLAPVPETSGNTFETRPRHLPTTVRYALVETDPGSLLLVREESDPRDTESEEPFKTLLAMNVASITITPIYPPVAEDPEDRVSSGPLPDRDGRDAAGQAREEIPDPVPTGVELLIAFEDGSFEDVRRRWELPRVDMVEMR